MPIQTSTCSARCREPLGWGLPAPRPKESGSAGGVCSAITTSSTLLPETTCAAHTRGSSGKIDFLLSDQIIHSSVHVSLLSGFPPGSAGARAGEGEPIFARRPKHSTFGFCSPRTGKGSRERGERRACWESWFSRLLSPRPRHELRAERRVGYHPALPLGVGVVKVGDTNKSVLARRN